MTNKLKYFIGNWKMFGVPKSINIPKKINNFIKSDKNSGKYKVIITPPYTLLQSFSRFMKNKRIKLGAQNCFYKDPFSSNTGAVSPYMLKNLDCKFVIIGHSDNRLEGDNEKIIKDKIRLALKNNLNVIFCIGENANQKRKNQTFNILKKQLIRSLEKRFNYKKILIAYEPIWSIGTGKIQSSVNLLKTAIFIKKTLKNIFKTKKSIPILYGGSVEGNNIKKFKLLNEIDGFLIGGASRSSKNFIDIIKNYYR